MIYFDKTADQCSFTLGGQQVLAKDAKRLLLGGYSCRKILYFAEDKRKGIKASKTRLGKCHIVENIETL